ncbi:protein FAM185A isoform X1 [Myripristis murdjan]|uniref:Family with sequence similarity 185 member A n=1 Tax=Myripristis murdjan TaxID=586833 RepID=A0A667YCI1_9TELE|nr:protein FAM185A isoform X1 [Myripristis murdjan]
MFWCSVTQRLCVGLLRCRSLPACPKTPTGCHLSSVRSFSASPCSRTVTPAATEGNKPLKQWTLVVSPFSTVRVRLGCSISIRPLDPHAFPEANRAFVTVRGTSADQGVKLDNFHVHYDDQSKELLILAEKVNSNMSVELSAPIKSNLYVTTQGKGNVQVQKMECDVCMVQTEKGNCVLHSVKGHQVEVQSHGGHVTGVGTIHGNVDISAHGDSAVDVKKLQGTKMNVSTEHGPLKVKAIYAESTSVSSSSGKVELGHVHGNATVKSMSGDVIVDGSNGSLKVSSDRGDIDVYVGDNGSADLHSQEGAVCVRVPSSLRVGVELSGASVDISPEVLLHGAEHNTAQGQTTVTGYVNGDPQVDQRIKAQADRGSIRLKTQSWFESLKLGS